MAVTVALRSELVRGGVPEGVLAALDAAPYGFDDADLRDVHRLRSLVDDRDLARWVHLTVPYQAARLVTLGVPYPVAAAVLGTRRSPGAPPTRQHLAASARWLVATARVAETFTVHPADLSAWDVAGLLPDVAPYIDRDKVTRWRSASLRLGGMRMAAACAAAGLGIEEAVSMVHSDGFDLAGARMLATLNGAVFSEPTV